MFHDDFNCWRWLVRYESCFAAGGRGLISLMYNIVVRPPRLAVFSDASKHAIGGYCLQTGGHYYNDLPVEEHYVLVGRAILCRVVNDICIDVLELLGKLI